MAKYGSSRVGEQEIRERIRSRLELYLLGGNRAPRFTQDSPILPDVWFAFADPRVSIQDLLLTPHRDVSAGRLAQILRDRLQTEREGAKKSIDESLSNLSEREKAQPVGFVQGIVAVGLSFEELIRVVLPMTPWWQEYVWRGTGAYLEKLRERDGIVSVSKVLEPNRLGRRGSVPKANLKLSPDLQWMIEIVGFVGLVRRLPGKNGLDYLESVLEASREMLLDEVARLVRDLPPPKQEEARLLWRVDRNRPVDIAVQRSTLSVKADAARRLFEISCRKIAWAVVDSGIDASHSAFRRWYSPKGGPRIYPKPFVREKGKWRNRTRIRGTYDFTRVRDLLDPSALVSGCLSKKLEQVIERGEGSVDLWKERLNQLRSHLISGREIDWRLMSPFLKVPHTDHYEPPRDSHGTHVAGILAADWGRKDDPNRVQGICPDIELYDLRVLDERGQGDELAVIAALQFLRHLNAERDHFVVHGVNLSLSIRHDVANYACGRTPVCEECERVVGNGVVAVAAAGNLGYLEYQTSKGLVDGFHTVSITDPGNAEGVITVGATHRSHPHTYGVSYFSSRGPTGDGRMKPDVVAPGEKIMAPIPRIDPFDLQGGAFGMDDGEFGRKDGTSMAAPHVSGAAALLMARHREFAGDPHRVKKILCETATDLGRERYFQGSGMVDILRALQEV